MATHIDIESDKFVVVQRFDGGMGTCYRIIDAHGTSYALKVIHSDLILDENAMYRYNEELKLWLTFSACDGVAEAKCIIKINDIPCVVSSWMENGDLNGLITDMNLKTFYTSMDRVITALKWVYDKYKVIHRDLKPGNILIDKENKAYVADWGLAKLISTKEQGKKNDSRELAGINPYLTQKGTFVGTVLYASPEQLLGMPNIDYRSDIYSLGCIMYQWETGKPPFVGNTIQEIASGHLYTKPTKIGGFFKNTNFKAESIIMKCLEKKPDNRYQSYGDLLADLHKIAAKKISNFVPYTVRERYIPVNIGHDEFVNKLKNGEIGILGKKGYGLIEQNDVMPYIKEAMSLSGIGEHSKSVAILKKLFVKEMVEKFPDFGFNQMVAINLAYELNCINESKQALSIIKSISEAKVKPSEYFVNLSNIYISLLDFSQCVSVCEEGLNIFPNDHDLIGNYTIGLTQLGRLDEAMETAKKRLGFGRSIQALCEAASVVYNYAETLKNTNFPKAISLYKDTLSLYREALELNPRYQVAMYNVSLLLFKMKRYTDAMNYGVEISKIEKGTSEVNAFYVARNMLWTSQFEAALKFCDNWLKTYPNSILLKRIRAEVLVDGYVIDNYTKDGFPIVEKSSLEFFTNIVKDKKTRLATDVIFLAKIHCWMNEPEDIDYGLKLLEWGKRQYPDNWKFNFYLAAFALKYKKPEKALQEALECQHKAPWRESAYNMLAQAYSANNNEPMAAKMRMEYERINKQKKELYDSCKGI